MKVVFVFGRTTTIPLLTTADTTKSTGHNTEQCCQSDICTCICKFLSGPFGTFYCFANAHFIVNSRWTSEHFSIVEIRFFAGAKPESVSTNCRMDISKDNFTFDKRVFVF